MPSSPFTKAKLRLFDSIADLAWLPSRIDPAASISPHARVLASRLHGRVIVGDYARLYRAEVSGPVSIGSNTSLWGPRIYVFARGAQIEFGNFCSVARDVSVHGYGHDSARISTHYIGRNVLGRPIEEEIVTRGLTRIGHDVWIGAGVHIMAGTTIGTGAVIGAGSVVSKDVPPYAIAVGAPAVPLRYRFKPEVVERLLSSAWWEWTHEQIRAREELFTQPLTSALLDRYL